MANLRGALSRAVLLSTLALSSMHAAAEPQNGWWWNPDESGRGYFIEVTGGVFYLAGYFYDSGGRATWMSASGAVSDLYSISGTLQSYRNGQSMFGAYRRPDAAVDVGTISITFRDDSHGTITWPGGTIPIERQIFDEDETLLDLPKTGWWWNPAESGSGYSVEIQGSTMFVVAFMYDESGNPIWYLTAGAMDSPTHFEGDWLEYSGGQTMAGPYRAPTSRNLGRVTIDFTALDQGTITFTESATVKRLKKALANSSKATPRSRRSSIGPQFTGPVWNTDADFWPGFSCNIVRKIVTISEAGTTGTFTTTEEARYAIQFDYVRQTKGHYTLNGAASAVFDYSFSAVDTSNGCTRSAHQQGIRSLAGSVDINWIGLTYKGLVYAETVYGIPVTVTAACVNPEPPRFPDLNFSFNGRSSSIQDPISYLSQPRGTERPFIAVRNTHSESDGSSIEWQWDCDAVAP